MPHKVSSTSYDDCKKKSDCRCIECVGKKKEDGTSWSKCDYKQFCAKISNVNKQLQGDPSAIKSGRLPDGRLVGYVMQRVPVHKTLKKAGWGAARVFRNQWNRNVGGMSEAEKKAAFYDIGDDCAYKETKQGTDVSKYSPDHVQEMQHNGSLEGPFKWLPSHVNESLGPYLQRVDPAVHKEIVANCCPA
jgi:hypothetical protein